MSACLAACMVGPDYHAPEPQMPEQWSSLADANGAVPKNKSMTVPTPVDPVDIASWWSAFHDPLLTSLIERAVAGNVDLHQAAARIRQARATQTIASSGLWPGVDTSASYTRAYTSSSLSGSSQSLNVNSNFYRAGFDAAWELDFFGGVRRGIEAADADIESSVEDRRSVMVSLAAELATTYCDVRGAQQALVITKQNLEAQQHAVGLTNDRYKGGLVSALDVANAEAQAATTSAQIPSLESRLRQSIYALGVLLGEEPGALVTELASDAPLPPIPPEVPVGVPSELLRRRPDVRKTEADLHAATARIGVATADLYPQFSIVGTLGLQGSKLGSLSSLNNGVASIGPSVTWPVFHAGAIEANVEVQRALTDQAYDAYRKAVLTALQDVESALVAYAKEQERRTALIEAARVQAVAVDLATQLYTAGKTDFLNVLSAQELRFSADSALVASNQAVVTDLVALYKALGGGWSEPIDADARSASPAQSDAARVRLPIEESAVAAQEPLRR